MAKSLGLVLLLLFCASVLVGCETVKGIGRDVQNTGEVMNDVFYVKDRSDY